MSSDGNSDEVFDEEEIADGFDEEAIGEEDLEDVEDVDVEDVEDVEDIEVVDVVDVDDVEEVEDEDVVAEVVVVEDDEVLAETIRRTSTPEDDEEVPGEVDTLVDPAETILPKQDDEFRCSSCRLLKKTSQLSDRANMLCRDCV